jgi:hypothetical protein
MGQEVLLAGDIAVTQAAAVPQATPYRPPTPQAGAAAPVTDGAISVSNGPPLANPSLHLDLALNLVVLQFFNAQGEVTQSIPSQKQLEAYQQEGSDGSQTVSKLL